MSYPVLSVIPEVKEKLAFHPVVILEAPPGAGKSTILPLHLLNEAWLQEKKIILLEPRRLAARSVAMRMSDLRKEVVGETVGYRVRFENKISKSTRIEVVTEGILTRLLQYDNALEGVGLVIFDEFHERSLQADLALALCLQVQEILRDDLRILIMSATLDGDRLSAILRAPVVRSAGKQYTVTQHYLPPEDNGSLATHVFKGIRKALRENPGDVLAFLPGAGEIKRTAEMLQEQEESALIVPLYGDLNFKKQQEAILPDPQGRRKVVLATSIAETSLTIEGVSIVVDSGYSRVPRFDPRSGLTRLETVRVTRDAADQRAGRAGRLGPGVCYRLWSQSSHIHLVAHRNPEILDADLASLMLELAQWNIQDINDLKWITLPPAGAVNQAVALLEALGAIENLTITERGREILRLPTHPRIAHMLLEAKDHEHEMPGALATAIDIAAVLEERDPLPKGAGADLSLRIEMLRRWRQGERVSADRFILERIERLASAWRHMFRIPAESNAVADTQIGRWVVAAYPERIGKQTEKHSVRYKLANGRIAKLPEHDPLCQDTWIAIAEVDAGSQEGRIFLGAPLDEQDLRELAVETEMVYWDHDREKITGALESRIGNLVLSSTPLKKISEEKSVQVFCDAIRGKGLAAFLDWGDEQYSWQARVNSLRIWRPEDNWPDVSDETLLQSLEEWLGPFLNNLYKRSELLKLDLSAMLNTRLPWALSSRLAQLAPPKMTVPSGSAIRLQYFQDGRQPIMEVRLQEVFGMMETPTVNEGRTSVVMHLLSPGYKPVQVTQDLKSFWANTYAEVRKELRARYPKHSWPEDPLTAQAIRGPRKRLR